MAKTLITDRHTGSAHYKILRRLGKGGMAEVFLARQEGMAGLRRLTVVKKLLPQFSQMADVAEMLLDEARIAAQLNHPNIVQIFELGKEDGQYFIVMEFVDGCDLATLARIERHRTSRVPLRLTVRAVSEAAMGLDFAHRQIGLDGRPLNIVHRDVSPHNIMCSREGAVKVTDFGIAKAVGKAQVTQIGVVKGKVQYMSPEQYTGGQVDHRSDIYSLGVVLYQLTTGRLPRVGDDGEVVMHRVLEGKVPRPSELRPDYPEELEAIVMRALAHDPENRYPDAASLRDDLLDFARENDLLAFPKDLGDYVNAMVPPVPLVIREQSNLGESSEADQDEGQEGNPGEPLGPGRPASVIVADEDLHTSAPHGTEPASPRGRRRSARDHSGAFDATVASSRAITPHRENGDDPRTADEQPTPRHHPSRPDSSLEPAAWASPLREQPIQPRAAHLEGASEKKTPATAGQGNARAVVAAEEPETSMPTPTPSSAGVTPIVGRSAVTQATGRRRGSPLLIIVGLAGVAAVAMGIAVWAIVGGRPSQLPPPGDPGSGSSPSGAGVINVLSNPSLASVSVDGAQRCPSTPCQIAGLPLNRELLVTLRAHGHTMWMQRLVLTPGEPKLLLRADLSPEAPAPPPDARRAPVASDKKEDGSAGEKPEKKADEKKGRKHSKHGGKKASEPSAPVAKQAGKVKSTGKMTTVSIDEAQAVLTVDVRPWAEVWVDGQNAGHTPLQRALPPGPHKVELKNPELGYSKTYRIRSELKKKIKINEVLQPPPGGPPGG